MSNTLLKFRHTPSGRTKQEATDNVRVTTGASSAGNAKQWELFSVNVSIDDDENTSYWIRMDRETAARVAKHLTDYLAAVKS